MVHWMFRDQDGPEEEGDTFGIFRLASSAAVTDDAWHHAVAVYDLENLKARLYVDRAAMSIDLPADQAQRFANTDEEQDPAVIGGEYGAGTSTVSVLFTGLIDEVSFYDAALTSSQVTELFEAPAGKCPP
jgi:hypothetical protein